MPDLEVIRQLADDVGADTAVRLMGIFKNDAETRIEAIRGYLAGQTEIDDLRLHAHSLKGLCRTYGVPRGGDVAVELQDACDGGDETVIKAKAQAALDIIPGEVAAAIQAARALAEG